MTNPHDPLAPTATVHSVAQGGLTKREYFAALAMQGYCANPSLNADIETQAYWATEAADKLIDEINKPTAEPE